MSKHCRRMISATALSLAALAGCTTPGGVESPGGIQAQAPMLVVIDDPRSARRSGRAGRAAYSGRFNYADDPVLHRRSSEIAGDHDLQVLRQWPLESLGVHCFVVNEPDPQTMQALQSDPRIRWVQPFNEFEVNEGPPPAHSTASGNLMQRFLRDVDSRGEHSNIVVIDTGADTDHPAIAAAMVSYQNFVDDGSQGLDETHGTAVLGVIAASTDDQRTMESPASLANIHHLRACWEFDSAKGRCDTLTLALALDAAIALQPDIVNLSLTGPEDPVLEALVDRLVANGSLVVAAYDDQRAPTLRFPRARSGVVHVYGVEQAPNPELPTRVLFAPRHTLSLAPMAGYQLFSGHSAATPAISAMLASLLPAAGEHRTQAALTRLQRWLDSQYPQRPVALSAQL